jgi:hypothetical protein
MMLTRFVNKIQEEHHFMLDVLQRSLIRSVTNVGTEEGIFDDI